MEEVRSKIQDMASDPQALAFELRKRQKDLVGWVIGFVCVVLVFVLFSSKDFSFLLVLSTLTQTFSFVILLYKVLSNENCSGVSLNTIVSYVLVLVARLSSTVFYTGYLPSDEAGDWLYQLSEFVSLGSLIVLWVMIAGRFNDTYNFDLDGVKWQFLAVPSIFLGLLFHTTLNNNVLTDILWSFSMYLEGAAILPQIYLFREKKGQIESFTSHYVSLQGLSRLFSLVFWWYTYDELNEVDDTEGFSLFPWAVGYLIMLSQIAQLLIMIDYFYFYFKSLLKGEELTINEL